MGSLFLQELMIMQEASLVQTWVPVILRHVQPQAGLTGPHFGLVLARVVILPCFLLQTKSGVGSRQRPGAAAPSAASNTIMLPLFFCPTTLLATRLLPVL